MAEPLVRGIVQTVVVASVMGKFADQDEHGDNGEPVT